RSWSLVKTGTTAAQKKLFFNLRSMKEKLGTPAEQALSSDHVTQIAKDLNVQVEEVTEMEQRLANPDYSLNTTVGTGEDLEWQDWIQDEEDNQEEKMAHEDEFQKRMQMVA